MARISAFYKMTADVSAHPTSVDCGYQSLTAQDGTKLLQLSTFGSTARKSGPKVSQTLQIDRVGAEALAQILRNAFPEIR